MPPHNPQNNSGFNEPHNPYYPPGPAGGVPSPNVIPPPVSLQPSPAPVSRNTAAMHSHRSWIICVVLLSLLLLGALGFGFWAFSQRQDYKDNSDQKVAAAVGVAKKQTTEKDNQRFAEELKNPLKTYTGPSSYGSISVQYPKTWSAYVNTASSGNAVLDAYFHPDVVPSTTAGGTSKPAIALRIQVLNQAYNDVVGSRKSLLDAGQVTAAPFALPKVPSVVGVRYTGKLPQQLNGIEILLPLRDKTLSITTETDQYLGDFNNYILPNLSFVP
jgi:hypothetical protein